MGAKQTLHLGQVSSCRPTRQRPDLQQTGAGVLDVLKAGERGWWEALGQQEQDARRTQPKGPSQLQGGRRRMQEAAWTRSYLRCSEATPRLLFWVMATQGETAAPKGKKSQSEQRWGWGGEAASTRRSRKASFGWGAGVTSELRLVIFELRLRDRTPVGRVACEKGIC